MQSVQILWVGRFSKDPGDGVKSHSHSFYHMICVHAGELSVTAGGKEFRVPAGSCILIPKEMKHAYINRGIHTADNLEIKFSLPSELLDKKLSRHGALLCSSPLAAMLFAQIVGEYSDLGSLADEAAADYMRSLLQVFLRQQRYQKQRQFRFVDGAEFSELSQRIIHYLEEHYGENVNLDTLAQSLGYNKSYLCTAFKDNTHLTINDCLNMIRIRRAAELVAYSDNDLATIAGMCGFASASNFNRVFLRHVGTTPGQCRKAYPTNVPLSPDRRFQNTDEQQNRFMYCVLAQKKITPEMILNFEKSEARQRK